MGSQIACHVQYKQKYVFCGFQWSSRMYFNINEKS